MNKISKEIFLKKIKGVNNLKKENDILKYFKSKSLLKKIDNLNSEPLKKELSQEELMRSNLLLNEVKILNPIELSYFFLSLYSNLDNDFSLLQNKYKQKQEVLTHLYHYPDIFAKLMEKLSSNNNNAKENNEETSEVNEKKEEKKIFDLKLKSFETNKKLLLIKEIKNTFGLGLKESKDLIEKLPSTLKKQVLKEEAENLKKKLETIGCVIELA